MADERTRACDRPTCSERATALLVMDGPATTVHLLPMVDPAPPLTLALCGVHADRLRVPIGWVLHDERAEGQLFEAPAPKRKRRPRAKGVAEAEAAASPPDAASPPAGGEGAGTGAVPRLELDVVVDLDGVTAEVVVLRPERQVHPAAYDQPLPLDEPAAPVALLGSSVAMPPPERRLLHRAFRGAAGPDPEPPDRPGG